MLPRKCDFTLKMLCMHHMIPNRYNYASGDFYSWLFDRDHAGNRTTKLCLVTYLIPLYTTLRKTSKSWLSLCPRRSLLLLHDIFLTFPQSYILLFICFAILTFHHISYTLYIYFLIALHIIMCVCAHTSLAAASALNASLPKVTMV